jgi:Fe-S oxidoreductase
MTENLRIGPTYRTLDVKTGFSFSDEGGFAGAIEMCNGQGACRKVLSGTMCPSYMVTRDEEHSTRGRANALRAAMSGALPVDSLTSRRMHEVLDLCLECKGCTAECPSNVDMAKLKYEFLYRYHRANGFPLANRVFGNIASLSRLGSFFAPLSNWALGEPRLKDLLEKVVGIDRRRSLPTFAGQTFTQWFRARGGSSGAAGPRGQVLLFADTFTNYNYPHLGVAATRVLERLGYQVVVPSTVCCGRPMLSQGMLDKARRNARANVDRIYEYVERGVKVVGLEPSCILTFKDDYVDLLGGGPKERAVSQSAMLIEEFVLFAQQEGASLELASDTGTGVPARTAKKVLFHGHCHQKALVGTRPAMEVLRAVPGCEAEEIQSGCCGMAGAFGYQAEHYEVSMKIGQHSLFGPIRSQRGDFEVVTEGVSCRQQIKDGTGKTARHLVEVLADAL